MNGQIFPGLNEQINRETRERLVKVAAANRQARKGPGILRLLSRKKVKKVERVQLPEPVRNTSLTPSV